MKLEKGIISSFQLYLLIFSYILGSSLLISIISPISKHNSWLAILLGLIEGILFAFIYISLSKKFPDKSIIKINTIIYGKYPGKIVSFLYITFLIPLISLNLRYFGDFFVNLIMQETPLVAFMIIIGLLSAYAVKKGIEVIARCSFLIIFSTIFIEVITFFLLIKNLDFSNFLPIINIELNNILRTGNIVATIPFGEIVIFLMILPSIKQKNKVGKTIIYGILSGGFILLLISIRDIAVLGNTAKLYSYPSYQAVRLINIADIFTRLEILVAISMLATMFLKISIIYYSTSLAMAELFNLHSYSPLVIPIGIISITLGLFIFEFFVEQINFGRNIYPIISLPFEFGIPLLSLIIAKFRTLGE